VEIMFRARRFTATVIAVALLISLIPGCGDDDGSTGTQPTPPEIPPLSSFLMEFSDFESGQPYKPLLRGEDPVDDGASMHNWAWAATNVLVWNTIITVGLAVPLAAFIEAFDHEPTRQPDSTWVWDYNFIAQDVIHLAELHGKIAEEKVLWEMYISKEGEYIDFLWYSGQCDLSVTEGTWTLFNNPADPTPLVGIEWHRYPETATGDIKYTNIVPDGPENGGYIFYGTAADGQYDAFYDIYNKGLDNHTEIEWDRTTKAGRVKDQDHFDDGDWHCWDSELQDGPCALSQ
jgi:hypothetical protein